MEGVSVELDESKIRMSYVLVLYDSTICFYAGFLASQLEITAKWLSQGTRDSGWRSDCQAAAGFVM